MGKIRCSLNNTLHRRYYVNLSAQSVGNEFGPATAKKVRNGVFTARFWFVGDGAMIKALPRMAQGAEAQAAPQPQPSKLPRWSIGTRTMTLFKDGDPTGTELVIHNMRVGSPFDLVEQANAAGALLPVVRDLVATLRTITADPLMRVGEACARHPNLVGTTLYATECALAAATKGRT
jgi:hypothetical protein